MSRPSRSRDGAGLVAADFFVLRTPLLPYDDRRSRVDGALASGAGDRQDRARSREAWRAIAARAEVREALWLASQALEESLSIWERHPESERGQKIERALVRYLLRMQARPTPFGLFAGLSVGRRGDATRLELAPRARYRRRTRLDMDYLAALSHALEEDSRVRSAVAVRPASHLHAAADQVRYVQRQYTDDGLRHELAAVESTEFVSLVLSRAEGGARPEELAVALVSADPEISREEAAAFVDELVAIGLLVADLEPPVTGDGAAQALIQSLSAAADDDATARALRDVVGELETLDAEGLGHPPERYRDLAARAPALPAPARPARLFQVDLLKPAAALTLGDEVLDEIARGVALLHRLAPRGEPELLRRFRQAFAERYEDREVPLLEAVDEESGIGLADRSAPEGESSPLLAGLRFPPLEPELAPLSERDEVLFEHVARARRGEAVEIELRAADLAALETRERLPLPSALSAAAVLAARSAEDVDAGRFQIAILGAWGPSGARMLGRFCHLAPELRDGVRRHLRHEEALRPDAIFAEIVHLPEGRVGNVLQRPLLREHELPLLGRSGAARERQIPLSDLRVRLVEGRIQLRSARHEREVIPRLSTAHSDDARGLGLYRLLCALQDQGVASHVRWSWGGLGRLPGFFPRVRVGRLVLARAAWRLAASEIARLAAPTIEERFRAVQELRREHRLPDSVVLGDGDHRLVIDLDEPLGVESFAHLVRSRKSLWLEELFPAREDLCVSGPEGRFVHELIVPFTRPEPPAARAPLRRRTSTRPHYPPGSEWLYAKLYTGRATADRVLTRVVAPLVDEVMGQELADGWFFLRYADPDWHLRLRFHGEAAVLLGELWPALGRRLTPLLADGRSHRLALDTYTPEIDRYGGERAIHLAERIFHADSDAALVLLAGADEGGDAAARWRLLLRGMDRLLDDLRIDLDRRAALLSSLRQTLAREHRVDIPLERQLGRKYRAECLEIESLLDGVATPEEQPGLAALARRSERIAPVVDELLALERTGQLTATIEEIARSLLHMHANRVMRSAARAHELVLYDFLGRSCESRRARRSAVRSEP